MKFEIREIDLGNKKERSSFIDMAWSIYKNDSHWVPPLKMAVHDLLNVKKHPFYKTADVKAFVAVSNGEIIGRVLGVNNHTYNKFEKNSVGHFGMFECINNQEVANALLDHARDYLKTKNLTSMQGPMNPGTNYECGLLVNDYSDDPQIMMTYNPPYYETLLMNYGMKKAKDLLAYSMNPKDKLPDVVLNIADRVAKKANVTFRPVNLKNWTKELDTLFEMYNEAWSENWGFVPMTREEFNHTAKDLKAIVDPSLILYALVDGKEAGFILTLPDLNQVFKTIPSGKLSPLAIYKLLTAKKRITRARTVMMGVRKEYRRLGLETLLYTNTQHSLTGSKITEIEFSWILEDNLEMNKPLIRMAGPAYKTYRLLEKSI